jgi:hypothetical protein
MDATSQTQAAAALLPGRNFLGYVPAGHSGGALSLKRALQQL